MSEKSKCILCEKDIEKEGVQGRNGYSAECPICGKYFLASPEIFEGSYIQMPREKRKMISAYTRELFECREEMPVLEDPNNLEEIITEYENKSPDKKLENLIWYIRKKSSQFEDNVPLNGEKDYPITYSLSPQEFNEILNNSIEQKLVEPTESGYKLTEKGWKLGTRFLESKKRK